MKAGRAMNLVPVLVKRLAPVSKLHETSVTNSCNVDRLINKKEKRIHDVVELRDELARFHLHQLCVH